MRVADGIIKRRNPANRHRRADRIDIHIGNRLRAQRVTMAMTQAEFGRRLGITFQQVQKYERGRNRVSASTLWKAAQILRVPLVYFFLGLNAGSPAGEEIDGVALYVVRRLRRLDPSIRREFIRVLTALSQP
jgi:transcriptional regulator with XRE-family HTH domain